MDRFHLIWLDAPFACSFGDIVDDRLEFACDGLDILVISEQSDVVGECCRDYSRNRTGPRTLPWGRYSCTNIFEIWVFLAMFVTLKWRLVIYERRIWLMCCGKCIPGLHVGISMRRSFSLLAISQLLRWFDALGRWLSACGEIQNDNSVLVAIRQRLVSAVVGEAFQTVWKQGYGSICHYALKGFTWFGNVDYFGSFPLHWYVSES